jgi:hypothetical protein
MKRLTFIISCIFILGNAVAQETYQLFYKYEKGKTYRYQEETKYESVQEFNGQEMKATGSSLSLIKMAIENVTGNGDITLIHSYEDMKVSTKMATMDTTMVMKDLLDKKNQITISRSGKLIEQKVIDTVDIAKNIVSSRSSLSDVYKEFGVFPEGDVKTGDTWNNDQTDTVDGTQMVTKTTRKLTLAGIEEKNGHSCLKITYTGTVEIGGKMNRMGMDFFMEGNGEISGSIWFDQNRGIIIAKEGSSDQDMTMAMTGQMQMTIPITTSSTSKFFLVE